MSASFLLAGRGVARLDHPAPVSNSPRASDSRTPAEQRIDERGNDDERALEDILVGLGKPEERHRVQDFGQQHGAHHGADEGAAPAAEARPAKNDCGYARERVVYSLPRVADP